MVDELRKSCSLLSPRLECFLKDNKLDHLENELLITYKIECIRVVYDVRKFDDYFDCALDKLEKGTLGKKLRTRQQKDPEAFKRDAKSYSTSMYTSEFEKDLISRYNLNRHPKSLLKGTIQDDCGIISETDINGHFEWWINRTIDLRSIFTIVNTAN